MKIKSFLTVNVGLLAVSSLSMAIAQTVPANSHLKDWKDWETYRTTVQRPTLTIKTGDVARARENIKRYPWAQAYAKGVEDGAKAQLAKLTPEFLENMIPETTPGEMLFTPCPACRDQGKPRYDHGNWTWLPTKPDELLCKVCATTFPNAKYPETVELKTTWGKPQTHTFYGGEPFPVFSYKAGRPSFTGNIRAQKVNWMAVLVQRMGEAYTLTGKVEYAQAARSILLRLSEVYPYWLIHAGYGEYADMDPKIAAFALNDLPEDEIVAPPNVPDRKLHTGYWTAGRARAVGMEGIFMRQVALAYDQTANARDAAGKEIYTDAERQKIERDLLLESTLLAAGDPALNNKSVGNSSSAALVGMTVGHPGLVRFGLDGFLKTVTDWFLPDGSTSESPAYANMTLSGIVDFAQAFRGYSDPPQYKDAQGKRLENFDLYHGTAYEKVWTAMFETLQGNLLYPPFADSYITTGMPLQFAELMAANYPERLQYTALLKELAGADLAKGHAATALYYREPGLEAKPIPPLAFGDSLLPELRIGYLREGQNGRGGLLNLSASHWGGHHHHDSLNLYYWKNGKELLSDLGYLWDHPQKTMTMRALAHNTVLIDEQDQRRNERGGEVLFFAPGTHIKAMRARSQAYAQTSRYERTSIVVDKGEGVSYVVDLFNVQGGATQDYIFHGPGNDYTVNGLNLAPHTATLYDIKNVKAAPGQNAWSLSWKLNPTLDFTAWSAGGSNEQVLIGDGWGQRFHTNSDLGATLPYIVRRTTGNAPQEFVSVFEGHAPGAAIVRSVRRLPVPAGSGATLLRIETATGYDYVLAQPTAGKKQVVSTPNGALETTSAVAVVSVQNGAVVRGFTADKAQLRFNNRAVAVE